MSTAFVKRGQLPLPPEFTQGIISYSNSLIDPTVAKFYWNLNFANDEFAKFEYCLEHYKI